MNAAEMSVVCVFTFILYIWINVSKGDGMGTSVLDKSKHCIEAATEAYQLLVQEEADFATTSSVIVHLESLTEDGKYLYKSAKDILDRLLSQEESLEQTLQQLQSKKQQLEIEIGTLNKEKIGIESSHSATESVLRDNEQQHQRAQKEHQDAENELQHAKKKAKKKKKGLLGKVKKFLGLTKSAEKKVKNAKHNLERRRSELQSAANAVSETKQAVLDIQNRIKQHEAKIQQTQQEVDKIFKEIGSIKSSIILLRKSTNFWELFIIAAENAEERTAALKKVVQQATEKQDYDILNEDGTMSKATSFIEAWEFVASKHRIL